MSADDKFLMSLYDKQQKGNKTVDEREVDLIIRNRQSGVVESILVWRRISIDRARRLQDRESKTFSEADEVCIVLSGKAVIGRLLQDNEDIIHI